MLNPMSLKASDLGGLDFEFKLFNMFQVGRDLVDLELRTATESRYFRVSKGIALGGVKKAVASVSGAIIASLNLDNLQELKLRNYLQKL